MAVSYVYLKNGTVGKNRKKCIPQNIPLSVELPQTQYLDIVWFIANFHDKYGGPTNAPIVNTVEKTKYSSWFQNLLNSIVMGIILMVSIYNFIFWFGRKKDKKSLLLSIFCFIVFLRLLVTYNILESLFPNISLFDLRKKIEYITMSVGWFVFIIYIYKLFPNESNKSICNSLKYSGLICSLFPIFTPVHIFTKFLLLYQIILIIAIIYVSIIISIAIYNKREGSFIILIGFLIMGLAIINDILVANNIINTFPAVSFGLVFFILLQSIILSGMFSNAFKTAEHLSQNLKQEVALQTQELRKAKEKIEQQSREKMQFFINITHETKTPLTLISNYLEKYLRKHKKNNELLIIKQNIEKLKNDMVNFFDVEKFERNQLLYNHEQVCDLSNIVLEKNIIFKETAIEKKIELEWNIEEGLFLKADPVAVDRILNNLLDNAVKYTETGGGIYVNLIRAGEYIKLSVSDTGVGISKDQQEHIFSPYYQLSHKKRNIQGLGMGLHITKKIVETLNGNITVNSQPGKGTEFNITFHKYEKQKGDVIADDFELTKPIDNVIITEKEFIVTEFNKDKKTIFIVEDNLQLVVNLKNELEGRYNVYFAINGKDAIEKLKTLPTPDIIISDIMMDVMDGYEFRERLIRIEQYKAIPFVFITAKGKKDEKLRGLSQGVVDYICKPFELPELKEKIKNWLLLIQLKGFNEEIELKPKHQSRLDNFIKEYDISPKEKEVLNYLLQGYKNNKIAIKMFISSNTVKKHIERIKIKLNISKKEELIKCLYDYVYK